MKKKEQEEEMYIRFSPRKKNKKDEGVIGYFGAKDIIVPDYKKKEKKDGV